MQGADFNELQTQVEIQFMDALTAAYDLGDSELVEELQDAYKQNQIGAEGENFDSVTNLRNLVEKLTEVGTDSEGLTDLDSDLYELQAGYAQGLNYNAPELRPPLGTLERQEDVEKILEHEEPAQDEPQTGQPQYKSPILNTFSR